MNNNADPTPETRTPQGELKQTTRKGCGCHGGCLVTLAVLSVLFGVLMVSLPMAARYLTRKSVDSAEWKAMEEMQTQPVHFPREWADVEPYSIELKAQRDRVQSAADALPTTATSILHDYESSLTVALVEILHGQPLTYPEAFTTVTELAEKSTALLGELAILATTPGYEADLLHREQDPFSTSFESSLLEGHTWLIVASTARAIQDQDCSAAVAAALLPLRMAQRHPASSTHREVDSLIYHGSHLVVNVSESCETEESLHAMLQALNQMEEKLHITSEYPDQLLSDLANLRRYKRDGFPSDLEPGKPGFHYAYQNLEAGFGMFAGHMVETLPFSDPRRAEYQAQIEQMTQWAAGPIRLTPLAGLRAARMLASDLIAAGLQLEPHEDSHLATQVYFDLARLRIARKLALLQGDQITTASATLVPRYLPRNPVDPFSQTSYLWDEKTEQYYSIGPDKHDDRLSSELDPSRRRQSVREGATGDIAVPATPTQNSLIGAY